ncbi:hypothetical protein KSD_56080 [Ktedonobacter sp. SOSP1-85]|nr:hypothetical protein KSD_56080 [Ktedonobacter sp. SOSP1-85]
MTANVRESLIILGWFKFVPYPVALTTYDELRQTCPWFQDNSDIQAMPPSVQPSLLPA